MSSAVVEFAKSALVVINTFFVIYLIGYSTYLFLSSVIGSLMLFKHRNYRKLSNRLDDNYYVPVSSNKSKYLSSFFTFKYNLA